eukprot:10546694-Alexandrium_andersonii.AAC.1
MLGKSWSQNDDCANLRIQVKEAWHKLENMPARQGKSAAKKNFLFLYIKAGGSWTSNICTEM